MMQNAIATNRPTMLVVCSCLPDPAGNGAQQHAWSLLRLVAQSHRVTLAVATDQAVHLRQWRMWSTVADRIELTAPRSVRPNLATRIRQWLGMSRRIESLTRQYDAALCSDPQWWPVFGQVQAATRLCDLHGADAATCRAIAHNADVVLVAPDQETAVADAPARAVTLLPVHDRLAQHIQSHRLALSLAAPTLDSRADAAISVTWRTPVNARARLAA